MFQSLKGAFDKVFEKISGRGKLTCEDVAQAAREIRLSLLAADVHFSVVKNFVDRISARAVGRDVLDSITPAEQFIKIVHDELVGVLGGRHTPFDFACAPPLVIMMVGLQGSGKTTTSAGIAKFCMENGRYPYLVPADVKRPAAIEQLRVLAREINVPCFDTKEGGNAIKTAMDAVQYASEHSLDTVIVDTAGRLHVDREMMDEIEDIASAIKPQRILYVADSMTGQDAYLSAKAFNEALTITGIVLTKLDGDARGGSALSITSVTGKPILFAGTGERIGDLEPFYPERMAGRILGMGDVVTLVEDASKRIDASEAEKMGKKLVSGRITFEDFISQMKMMKSLGPMDKILNLLPGMGDIKADIDPALVEAEMKKKEAMIQSMTREERANPGVLNGSRRRRIAGGAGVSVQELNRFLKEFDMFSKMMKKVGRGGLRNMFKGLTSQTFS